MGHGTDVGGHARATTPGLRAVPDASSGPFPATLPEPVPLVGREDDVARVLAALDGGQRLVTVTGPGGVGKTGLANEIGHRLWHRHHGSVLFVTLTFVNDADRVVDAIAAAAGWQLTDDVPALAQVTDRLAGQATVVVLDNCEQIAAFDRLVAELFAAWPTTALIATSRRALGLVAEQIIEIQPLPLPRPDAPWREIAANPAVTALVDAVNRRAPGYAVTRANATAVAELCIRLDGLPLALELAAARLHLVSPAELLALLDQRFGVLSVSASDRTPHHRRLWAAIDWSYQLLGPVEQGRFRRLATFVGGFTLEAATQLWATDALTALDTITVLADHHLVRSAGERAGASRFEMLESIREFARAELAAAGELDDAHADHADWAAQTAEQLGRAINGREQREVIATFDAERDNLRAALRWQIDHGDRDALRLAYGQWQYWFFRGAAREGIGWLHAALDTAGPDTDEAVALALLGVGNLHDSLGELRTAAELHERAVAAFERLGDRKRVAVSRHTLAAIARELGDLERAWQLQSDAAAAFAELDDHRNHAVALSGLGAIAYRRDDPDQALAMFLRAAGMFESHGDRQALAQTYDRIGLAYMLLGDPDTAATWHRRAQALGDELDDPPTVVYAMVNLATALLATGDSAAAADLQAQARSLATSIGDTRCDAYVSRLSGDIADHGGRIGTAIGAHARALDGFVRLGHMIESIESVERLARLVRELGAADLADACLDVSATARAVGADPAREWADAARSLLDDVAPFAVKHAETRRSDHAPIDPLCAVGLTPREAAVARLMVARRTDREIAQEMSVAVRTASTHVSAVLRKLGVASRRDVAERISQLGV